jgi:hypothetical protein
MYTCEGCGATFEGTPEEAFEKGWDTPERFMSHCTCPNCPITTTLWWDLMVNKRTTLTPEEAVLITGYNQRFSEYNEVSLKGADDE